MPENYRFAATNVVAPLAAQEAAHAIMAYAIGFIVGERVTLVAVQGLQPGSNLFVGADGRWLETYIPAVYRGYPFQLVDIEDGRQVLCVDEDSGLVDTEEGEIFFDKDGQPGAALTERLNFHRQLDAEFGSPKKSVLSCMPRGSSNPGRSR